MTNDVLETKGDVEPGKGLAVFLCGYGLEWFQKM